jgi:hypothetical protein
LAESWNGKRWRIVRTPTPPPDPPDSAASGVLMSVSCHTARFCIATGVRATSMGLIPKASPSAGLEPNGGLPALRSAIRVVRSGWAVCPARLLLAAKPSATQAHSRRARPRPRSGPSTAANTVCDSCHPTACRRLASRSAPTPTLDDLDRLLCLIERRLPPALLVALAMSTPAAIPPRKAGRARP